MTWLFELFGEWVKGFYMSMIQDFAEAVIGFVLPITDSFWKNDLLDGLLNYSLMVNGIVLVLTLVILGFDLAEEQKGINWVQVVTNLIKGGLFAIFARYIGQSTLLLSNLVVQNLQLDVDVSAIWSVSTALPQSGIAVTIIWSVIIIVAFVAFGVVCVMRNASMFVLMMSSALYIPDIIRGDTAKMGDWIRQVIAVSFTFVFQYILFHFGLGACIAGDPVSSLTGFAGIFIVPKLLQKYGYSSGVTGIMSSASNMVMQAGKMFIK